MRGFNQHLALSSLARLWHTYVRSIKPIIHLATI